MFASVNMTERQFATAIAVNVKPNPFIFAQIIIKYSLIIRAEEENKLFLFLVRGWFFNLRFWLYDL